MMATPPDFSVGQVLTAAHMDAVGLWKVASVNFSGGATSVDNCFTSDFHTYRIVWRVATSTGDPEIRLTLRVGGVNAITNYYTGAWLVDLAGTLNYSQNGAYSRLGIAYNGVPNACSGALDIVGPNIAANTSWSGNSVNSTGGQGRSVSIGGVHLTATAYDGFTLTPSTGTWTGNVTVYGYRD